MDTTDTTTTTTRTITLTGRPPVRIVESRWPLIAIGRYKRYDGEVEYQANRKTDYAIRVRQHEDGRAIVYAICDHMSIWRDERGHAIRVGRLLRAGDDIVAGIRAVGHDAVEAQADPGCIDECVRECIADLPAVDLD